MANHCILFYVHFTQRPKVYGIVVVFFFVQCSASDSPDFLNRTNVLYIAGFRLVHATSSGVGAMASIQQYSNENKFSEITLYLGFIKQYRNHQGLIHCAIRYFFGLKSKLLYKCVMCNCKPWFVVLY